MQKINLFRKNYNFDKNYYLSKTALVIGNEHVNFDFIKKNLNNNIIIICINDIIEYKTICNFYIDKNCNVYCCTNCESSFVLNQNFLLDDLICDKDSALEISVNLCIFLGIKNIILNGTINKNNLLAQLLFKNYNVHIVSLSSLNVDFIEQINFDEFKKIVNFRHLVFIASYIKDYSTSGVIRYLIRLFDEYNESYLFFKQGIKILTRNKLHVENNVDSNSETQKSSYEYICYFILMQNYLNSPIFFSFHRFEMSGLNFQLNKNSKYVIWQDDLHTYARQCESVKNNKIFYFQQLEPFEIKELELIDYLITPSSIYFKNLNITQYDNKIKDLFYPLDEKWFNIVIDNFNSRTHKIVLSGSMTEIYKTRNSFKKLTNDTNFKNLIYHIEHPGYSNLNEQMIGLNYYNELSKHKACFVGNAIFPINFLLAKHIEILMCGCLGFYEKNPLLLSQLGLIEYEHYVPCTDKSGNLITEYTFYEKWLNSEEGKNIALNGAKYVRQKFGFANLQKYIDFFNEI